MSEEEETSQEISQEEKTEEKIDSTQDHDEVKVNLKCPVPAKHVKSFEDCCSKFQKGEISEEDVITEVGKTLKELKKPDVESME